MDTDYSELDDGIRETVRWLNTIGFITSDSGDGSKATVMECAMGEANVIIHVPNADNLVSEAKRLAGALLSRGVHLEPINEDGRPHIQASWDPGNDIAAIILMCVDDKLLFPPDRPVA